MNQVKNHGKRFPMYRVLGYDMLCEDFEFGFDSFVKAVKAYKEAARVDVAFIIRDKPDTCLFVRPF